jgi:hypothetical protein
MRVHCISFETFITFGSSKILTGITGGNYVFVSYAFKQMLINTLKAELLLINI